jgi:hypothetical protein
MAHIPGIYLGTIAFTAVGMEPSALFEPTQAIDSSNGQKPPKRD